MISISIVPGLAVSLAVAGAPCPDSDGSSPLATGDDPVPCPLFVPSLTIESALDPRAFFEQLVARYRGLRSYRDTSKIVQVTQHLGDERAHRVETEVETDVSEGQLRVQSPASQLRESLGLLVPFRRGPVLPRTAQQYDLWLLPHLMLKFADRPLEQFREGVPEGFTATEAAPITIDDKPMVHLELRSGDGTSGHSNATFDLYVDPDSMLIERIHGQQRLPDGGNYETMVNIHPTHAESDESDGSYSDSVWSSEPAAPAPSATDAEGGDDAPPAPTPSPAPRPSPDPVTNDPPPAPPAPVRQGPRTLGQPEG